MDFSYKEEDKEKRPPLIDNANDELYALAMKDVLQSNDSNTESIEILTEIAENSSNQVISSKDAFRIVLNAAHNFTSQLVPLSFFKIFLEKCPENFLSELFSTSFYNYLSFCMSTFQSIDVLGKCCEILAVSMSRSNSFTYELLESTDVFDRMISTCITINELVALDPANEERAHTLRIAQSNVIMCIGYQLECTKYLFKHFLELGRNYGEQILMRIIEAITEASSVETIEQVVHVLYIGAQLPLYKDLFICREIVEIVAKLASFSSSRLEAIKYIHEVAFEKPENLVNRDEGEDPLIQCIIFSADLDVSLLTTKEIKHITKIFTSLIDFNESLAVKLVETSMFHWILDNIFDATRCMTKCFIQILSASLKYESLMDHFSDSFDSIVNLMCNELCEPDDINDEFIPYFQRIIDALSAMKAKYEIELDDYMESCIQDFRSVVIETGDEHDEEIVRLKDSIERLLGIEDDDDID